MIRDQHTLINSTTTKYYRSLKLDRYNRMSTAYLVQSENTAKFLAIIGRLHPIDDDRVKAMPASRLTPKIFSRPTTYAAVAMLRPIS